MSNQKSSRLRSWAGDFWNIQFTICILFWKDDSNLPKDVNVNRHLMKMACIDILSGLLRIQKIKVDLLEEIALQTYTFRVISLNLSYPQSRHLHPYCSPQASIKLDALTRYQTLGITWVTVTLAFSREIPLTVSNTVDEHHS